jgi:uncharacterized RDD family membrane protein YckC
MAVYRFAGFWRRLVAYTIDNIIINIGFTILFIIVLIALFSGAMSAESRSWVADLMDPGQFSLAILAMIAVYLALSIAYFTYFHGMTGRTPGKMILGLQVLSTEGTTVTFGTAFLRSVGYIISGALLNIGFIWAAFDRRKQGWHDKIAGTVVIIRPQENELAGIHVPDSSANLNIAAAAENQNTTGMTATPQPIPPIAGEDKALADQPGINGQKIP